MNRRRHLCVVLARWRQGLLWVLLISVLGTPLVAGAKDEDRKAEKKKSRASAPAEAVPDTWYVSTLSESEGGVLGAHYWSKGPHFRAETIVDGHRIATIVNADSYLIIDVVSGSGVAIARSAKAVSEDAGRGRPFGKEWDELMRDGGEKVRSQEMGGVAYDLFRVTNRAGRREVLVTRSEPRIPIRVETYDRSTGKTSAVRYMHWRRGIDIRDGFFEPPPDMEITRIDYAEYLEKIRTRAVGPAPVLYDELLHGEQER